MSQTWKQWEGRTVDGKYPLQSYLGGSDHSAVFLTVLQVGDGEPAKAAIKLLSRDANSENQAARWQVAGELKHPNLLAIFDAGRCQLDDSDLVYVVEEYAEENLAQILPERALTPDETRGMLPPILGALQFVRDKGFVHGRVQPSNIFAVGDAVKVSSDSLTRPHDKSSGAHLANDYDPPEAATGEYSAASDVWSLGMTLVEVLTQRPAVWSRGGGSPPAIPSGVPEPYREIARQCLQVDAAKRCTIAEIGPLLEGKAKRLDATASQQQKATPVPSIHGSGPDNSQNKSEPRKISKKWSFLLGLAAVLAVAFLLIPRTKPSGSSNGEQSQAGQPSPSGENSQSAPAPANSASTPGAVAGVTGNAHATNADRQTDVVRRVIPDVSPSAQRTIHGKIVVRVKVNVDTAGNVSKAKLDSGHASPYFKRLAMEAAQDWKFSPAAGGDVSDREWKLQFAFTRAKTEASAAPVPR